MTRHPFRTPLAWRAGAGACLLLWGAFNAAQAAGDVRSAVFIGNSITRHGPVPAIQWAGDWGMAASAKRNDYVSQVVQGLGRGGAAVKDVQAFNIAVFEQKPTEVKPPAEMLQSARAADLVVVVLGDNVDAQRVADFAPAYARLLAQARPSRGTLVCASTWWKTDAVDAVIKPACEQAGGTYVAIGDIQSKPGTHPAPAQGFTDPGVLRHPGDAGMAEIAKRLLAAVNKGAAGAAAFPSPSLPSTSNPPR